MLSGLTVTAFQRTLYISKSRESYVFIKRLSISLANICSLNSLTTSALQMFRLVRTVSMAGAVKVNSISDLIMFNAFSQSIVVG